MKYRIVLLIFLLLIAIIFTGCSWHQGYIGHAITTEVQLNNANYKVIGTANGTASADYIFGIGPADQNLYEQARRDMITKANLTGFPRAVINVTSDVKYSWFLIWRNETVYVSGDIVEFTK